MDINTNIDVAVGIYSVKWVQVYRHRCRYGYWYRCRYGYEYRSM